MLGSTGAYFQFEFLTFIYGTICMNLSLCALYRYSKVFPEKHKTMDLLFRYTQTRRDC